MKKYMLSMLTLALFAVGFVSSCISKSDFVGTYEVTDKVGSTMRIKLNEDESATITSVRGENVTYYCSWSWYEFLDCGPIITFSDKKPNFVYEEGTDYSREVCIEDGWLYSSPLNAEAKNPQWRLKIKKIN